MALTGVLRVRLQVSWTQYGLNAEYSLSSERSQRIGAHDVDNSFEDIISVLFMRLSILILIFFLNIGPYEPKVSFLANGGR